MHLLRADAQNRPCPVAAPVFIRHHLRFIYDGNVIRFPDIQNLHRGSLHETAMRAYSLLPGNHVAGDSVRHHAVVNFQRQQTQRSQINTVVSLFEPLQRLVSLAAVGGTDVQDKAALHGTRFRVLFLRLRLHQLLNPLPHQILHVFVFINFIKGLGAEKLCRFLHPGDILGNRTTRHSF